MQCSVDYLEHFIEHLLIGKLDPYVKSAPLPQRDDGLIKVNWILLIFSVFQKLTSGVVPDSTISNPARARPAQI